MAEKIIATLCGILNSGGGYLVIGVEDGTRRIVGIKTDKSMDCFLLMLDTIYHSNLIKKQNGGTILIDTIKSAVVSAANNKELLVVTATAEPNERYVVKDGSLWYRLAASNFKQTAMPTVYTEKELETIITQRLATQATILHQQFDIEKRTLNEKFQCEHNKIKSKFASLENDFENVVRAAKKTEHNFNELRELIYNDILVQKQVVEKSLTKKNRGLLSFLCCCL
jgi:predicted HTH transcriptional regulator